MISYVESTFSKSPDKQVTLSKVMGAFKDGHWEKSINELREILKTDKAEYKKLKTRVLPAILFSGEFQDGKHDSDLKEHSGLICLDWDNLVGNELWEHLKNDKYIRAAWHSPSGNGIKALVKIPKCESEEHTQRFLALQKIYPTVDAQCKNVSRLCYVCSDSELWENKDSIEFTDILNKQETRFEKKHRFDKFNGTEGEGRNNRIMSYAGTLISKGIDISDVENACFGMNCEFKEPMSSSEVRSIIKSISGYTEDINSVKIDFSQDYERPPDAIVIRRKGAGQYVSNKFIRMGEFSVINGWVGSKKSMLTSVLASVILGGNYEMFENKCTRKEVVFIDTEQSSYDIATVKYRVKKSGGEIEHLHAYKLRGKEIQAKIKLMVQIINKHSEAAIFFIDNISDLMNDNNEGREAKKLENLILGLIENNGAHFVLIIHSNKGDDHATGHIGSSIMKKCETGMLIKENRDDITQSHVSFWKNRGGTPPAEITLEYVRKNEIEITER